MLYEWLQNVKKGDTIIRHYATFFTHLMLTQTYQQSVQGNQYLRGCFSTSSFNIRVTI